jgi:beta-lactamase regulating signal transducer with metallopeptidase domain
MFVRRPMVVLPDDWRAWPAEQLDAVLAHEVSHVARPGRVDATSCPRISRDLWFSPLSWWLHRQLGRLAELASDESALAAGVEPVTYAGALLACFVGRTSALVARCGIWPWRAVTTRMRRGVSSEFCPGKVVRV